MRLSSTYRATSKNLFILAILFSSPTLSKAQCPDKGFLERRITYLRDSSNLSGKKQLDELNVYLEKMRDCSYRNDSTHVRLARRIGGLYYQEDDYLNAIKYYRLSIDIITANSNKRSVNLTELPGCYYWLSIMYQGLDRVTDRMIALDSCYKVAIRIGQIDAACLRALYEWGLYCFDIGDYHRCIDFMRQCESLAKAYPAKTPLDPREEYISGSLLWQAKALLEIKEYNEAERLLTDRAEECKVAGRNNNLGAIFSQLAELQVRKANYKEALIFYENSFTSDRRAGYNYNCKQTLKDIGYNIYFLHSNEEGKALAYYSNALKITNHDPSLNSADLSESLDLFRLIANVYSRKRQYDLANHYFQLAFDQIRKGINEMHVLTSSSDELKGIKKIHYLTSLIIDKADSYRQHFEATKEPGALSAAIRTYKVADQFLNKIKTEQIDVQSKLFWRSDSRRLYENAIEACYLQNDLSDAFYFFEKSRAVLLQDQLNEQRWSGGDNILRQTQLEKKIQQLEKQINAAGAASSNNSSLQNDIFNSKQELAQLQDLIKNNSPLYYQSFVDTVSLSTADVKQTILKDRQAMVELFTGDSAIYLLAITQQNSFLQKINKAEFDRLSDAYRDFISNPALLNRNFSVFKQLSLQLYQLIFRDINLPPGRIIISPDGKYFPFESLITSTQPLIYFLEDHAVSYTYSARYLLNDFSTNSSFNSNTFMGFAPLQYSGGLPALSGSDVSLARMQNYFRNATNFVGKEASRNNFINSFYRYKIIQLYTHATDSSASGEPVIYFSDSALALSDLFYEGRPSTSLIVLSACQTANGKLYNGEGVFSFSRQFAALGIPSSISNLWQVDNRSSYQITELFYKYLVKGLPLDIALQKAKKEFKSISSKERSLPYYWAAPVLVGRSDAIPIQKSFPWMLLTVGFLILVFVLGGLKIMRRHKAAV